MCTFLNALSRYMRDFLINQLLSQTLDFTLAYSLKDWLAHSTIPHLLENIDCFQGNSYLCRFARCKSSTIVSTITVSNEKVSIRLNQDQAWRKPNNKLSGIRWILPWRPEQNVSAIYDVCQFTIVRSNYAMATNTMLLLLLWCRVYASTDGKTVRLCCLWRK